MKDPYHADLKSVLSSKRFSWGMGHHKGYKFHCTVNLLVLLPINAYLRETHVVEMVGASSSPRASIDFTLYKPVWLSDWVCQSHGGKEGRDDDCETHVDCGCFFFVSDGMGMRVVCWWMRRH